MLPVPLRWLSLCLGIALPTVFVACAGELSDDEKVMFRNAGVGGTSTGAAGGGGPGGSGGGSSLDLCVVPLFKATNCSSDGCHGGAPVQAGLVLTETVLTQPGPLLLDRLNIGSTVGGCDPATFKLIDSAEPEKSLMYTKVTTPPCGGKMPIGPSLTATEAACVLRWIKSIPGVGAGGGAGGAAGSTGTTGAGGAGGAGAGGAAGTGSSGAAGRGGAAGAAGAGGTIDAGRAAAADSGRSG